MCPLFCCAYVFSVFLFFVFFCISRSLGVNVLGYTNPPYFKRCHPAYGQKGSSHLSPVLALRIFIAMVQVQHPYNSSTNEWLYFTHHAVCSHAFCYGSQNKNNPAFTRIKLTISTQQASGYARLPLDHSGDEVICLWFPLESPLSSYIY